MASNSSSPPPHIPIPQATKYKELISTLPARNSWEGFLSLYNYQGFWYYPNVLESVITAQDHFKPQLGDIILCSYPKTGTTWLKSLAFAISTRTQFLSPDQNTKNHPLNTKISHDLVPYMEYLSVEQFTNCHYPMVSTHVAYSALPRSVHDTGCKIVYVCRDPKDVFVSFWCFVTNMYNSMGLAVSMERAFDLFCEGISTYGPYLDHVSGYWKASLENPDKVMFLKYEHLVHDPMPLVKKLAEFMGCPFSEDEERQGKVGEIVEMCSFKKMSNLEVNKSGVYDFGGALNVAFPNNTFFRKGEIGDWRNYLTAEMGARLDYVVESKLSGTGMTFKFPSD